MRALCSVLLSCAVACGAPSNVGPRAPDDGRADEDAVERDAGTADEAAPEDAGAGGASDAGPPIDPVPDAGAAASSLADQRDAALDSLATLSGAERCATWAALDDGQRAVFLVLTDLLGQRTALADGSSALSHALTLLAVRGRQTEGCVRCCGDREFNRLYLSFDDDAIAALRANTVTPWRASQDPGGPHEPFTESRESEPGMPRGQIHFFASDADAVPLGREGVRDVLDAHAVEIDVDFNLIHESSPLCSYGGESGFSLYEAEWRDVGAGGAPELEYIPSGCE